ncbi:MAG: thioredoxin family protein [Candidatus Omnitrophota bacterium]|nr:TM0996/MTH895 family glutaredoxin-like protein [Candidatus Omnitrophota bacterium]
MKIEILGMGCPKCRKLYDNVKEAVKETGVEAEITKVTGIAEISGYGVIITPALVVDGKVKVSGRVPTTDDIRRWIK